MYVYIYNRRKGHASISMRGWLHRRTDRRCGARRTCAPACCVRVCVCDLAPTHPRRHVLARSAGVDRVWLGSQAFHQASAFNAHIGVWNTAAVTSLYEVCAASPARAARHRGRAALGGWSMRRGPLCVAATADARARVCAQTCEHAHARACTCVGIAACTKVGI